MMFLVRLNEPPTATYFRSIRGDTIYETTDDAPTMAHQMSFSAANEIARLLRLRGFENALVVDAYGQTPTGSELATAKGSIEYVVRFYHKYFCGQDKAGQYLGGPRAHAVPMSKEASERVAAHLRKMGFKDAEIIESDVAPPDVEKELALIWPSEFSKNVEQ
jgi:hypothetical protein